MSRPRLTALALLAAGLPADGAALAGEADIVAADFSARARGYSFRVTVRHDDQGWDHYADRWDVVGPDGAVLGARVLLHPHEAEQPFTRALNAVAIPSRVGRVVIRAHDSVHGFGGAELTVELP